MSNDSRQEPDKPESIPSATEPIEGVGIFLQQERLRQKKSLKNVAEATCIHISTLQALEEENRAKLPAEVFVRGFISIYAQHLGLDAQEALDRHGRKTSAEWVSPGIEYDRRTIRPPDKPWAIALPGKIAALLAVLLCLAGFWYWSRQPETPPVPAVPAETAPVAEALSPEEPASAPKAEEATPAPAAPPPPREVQAPAPPAIPAMPAAPAARPIPAAVAPPASPPAAAARPDSPPAPEQAEPLPLAPVQNAGEEASSLPAEPAYTLEAEFVEPTWVRVKIDGQEEAEYLFQPGERYTWKAREGFKIFLGNAGGASLTLNGDPLPPPGRSGQTARLAIPAPSP